MIQMIHVLPLFIIICINTSMAKAKLFISEMGTLQVEDHPDMDALGVEHYADVSSDNISDALTSDSHGAKAGDTVRIRTVDRLPYITALDKVQKEILEEEAAEPAGGSVVSLDDLKEDFENSYDALSEQVEEITNMRVPSVSERSESSESWESFKFQLELVKDELYKLLDIMTFWVEIAPFMQLLASNRPVAAYYMQTITVMHNMLLKDNPLNERVYISVTSEDGTNHALGHKLGKILNQLYLLKTGLFNDFPTGYEGSKSCTDDDMDSDPDDGTISLKDLQKSVQTDFRKFKTRITSDTGSFFETVQSEFDEQAGNPLFDSTKTNLITPAISRHVSAVIDINILQNCNLNKWVHFVGVQLKKRFDDMATTGSDLIGYISAMNDVASIFDTIVRDNEVSTANPMPHYHMLRWSFAADYMLYVAPKDGFFLYPSTAFMGSTDLIQLKAIPIGPIQLTWTTQYVDGHFQTPLEFWYHDFQHARRNYDEWLNSLEKFKNTSTEVSFDAKWKTYSPPNVTHEQKASFLEISLPTAAKLNKMVRFGSKGTLYRTDDAEERKMRQVVKFLIFEAVHEENVSMEPEIIVETLNRLPLGPISFRYEYQVYENGCQREVIGNIRVQNKQEDRQEFCYFELQAKHYPFRLVQEMPEEVQITASGKGLLVGGRGTSPLSLTYRKLRTSFYTLEYPDIYPSYLPPRQYVTHEVMATAAKRIVDELKNNAWSESLGVKVPMEEASTATTTRMRALTEEEYFQNAIDDSGTPMDLILNYQEWNKRHASEDDNLHMNDINLSTAMCHKVKLKHHENIKKLWLRVRTKKDFASVVVSAMTQQQCLEDATHGRYLEIVEKMRNCKAVGAYRIMPNWMD